MKIVFKFKLLSSSVAMYIKESSNTSPDYKRAQILITFQTMFCVVETLSEEQKATQNMAFQLLYLWKTHTLLVLT